jgi:hypothetical protein
MMKYLFLLHSPHGPSTDPDSAEYADNVAAYGAMQTQMIEAGVLIDCQPLYPVSASTTVRVRDGEAILTDGPAAEIKEQVGGYMVVECADLDEALKWATIVPAAQDGWVEVRPVIPVPAVTL